MEDDKVSCVDVYGFGELASQKYDKGCILPFYIPRIASHYFVYSTQVF